MKTISSYPSVHIAENFRYECILYKGFIIRKRIDVKKGTAIIYNCMFLVKCIAGDIASDGSENSIEKAKKYIDNYLFEIKFINQ